MATINDLYRVEGQAELIGGKVVRYEPMGYLLGHIAMEVASSLHDYEETAGRGNVYTATLVYEITELPSGRESFSPDVSYYDGPRPANRMKFISGPPTLAVEVRGEKDYSIESEREMAAKRADYFEAGTKVVWDVDTVDEVIHVYRSDRPDTPTTYGRGQIAEAEPAVPGWRVTVDDLFPTE
jgi:Uma2 family endonuclease